MFAELLSKNEKILFGVLAKEVIVADKVIKDEEKQYLSDLEKIIGQIDKEISFEKSVEELAKLDNAKKRAIITELLIIAKCDKNYAEEEKVLIKKINTSFGIPEEIFNRMDTWSDSYLKLIIEGNKMIEVDL